MASLVDRWDTNGNERKLSSCHQERGMRASTLPMQLHNHPKISSFEQWNLSTKQKLETCALQSTHGLIHFACDSDVYNELPHHVGSRLLRGIDRHDRSLFLTAEKVFVVFLVRPSPSPSPSPSSQPVVSNFSKIFTVGKQKRNILKTEVEKMLALKA